ncbi:hypothetical protein D3C81_1408420 [compost metagenome]
MRRFVVGDQIKLQPFCQRFWQRHEAHKRMQVMRLSADLLDAPLQFTAQSVARQHGRAVTMGHPPEHLVQQVPALLAAVTGSLLQLVQQRGRHFGAKRARAFGGRRRHCQQVCHRAL